MMAWQKPDKVAQWRKKLKLLAPAAGNQAELNRRQQR